MHKPDGIDGLQPRDPIGAAVSIGIKSSRGGVIETDRFHLVSSRDVDNVRPHLPHFAFFNDAKPEHRRIIRGNLLHRTRQQAFAHRLVMTAFPAGHKSARMHPHKIPACEGDGKIARRWQGDDKFATIKCPHKHCQYRQDPPQCKPFAQLLFRLRWAKEGLPTPLVKLTSRSWETTANLLGLFDMLEQAARELGVENPSLYGFPFTLTLIERTKAQKKARYPVVVVSPDQDPIDFFLAQKQRLAQLQGPQPLALPELQDDATVYEDIQAIEVPKS